MLFSVACAQAQAESISGPHDRSKGDPSVYAILTKQGFGSLAQGATLISLCSIRTKRGEGGYDLYWLEKLTQAAIVVHGSARIVAISRAGHVLGSYDSDMDEHPKCIGGNKIARAVDDGKEDRMVVHETKFTPDTLPHWLGGGSGFFSPQARYEGQAQVDGVKMPVPDSFRK